MYVAGGIVGSLAHCLWSYYQQKLARSKSAYHGFGYLVSRGALGASAAVNAIVMFDILLFPTRTILLYGIIPLPAALLGLLWFWNDVGGALSGSNSFPSIAYAGHLGGAAVGVSFWLAFRRGRLSPRSWW